MPEIELTDIFKNRWVKRVIFIIVLSLIIWKFFPDMLFWCGRNNLTRSAQAIADTIRLSKSYTMNHEDSYAADFNLQDNTFAVVYPKRRNPQTRKIVDEMKLLPGGIEIVKCTFRPILILGGEDPDDNQVIFRIRFDKNGNALVNDSAIWIGNERGQIKEISVTNPGGRIEIYNALSKEE